MATLPLLAGLAGTVTNCSTASAASMLCAALARHGGRQVADSVSTCATNLSAACTTVQASSPPARPRRSSATARYHAHNAIQ